MPAIYYQDEAAALYCGDSLAVLPAFAPDSFDSFVSDAPAAIGFMNADWDKDKGGRDRWIAWLASVMREAKRTMKPGAHGLVWALPRTAHWTGMALEDAGFEVRDKITHLFGQGFPKSLNVGRAIDEAHCPNDGRHYWQDSSLPKGDKARPGDHVCPRSAEGDEHRGRGTALKPASEDWILIRKPLSESSVTANVERYGTGALRIDDCRIEIDKSDDIYAKNPHTVDQASNQIYGARQAGSLYQVPAGRWPANVILDEFAAAVLDEQSGILTSNGQAAPYQRGANNVYGKYNPDDVALPRQTNSGGASRFFYVAKAGKAEREAGLESRTPINVNDGRETSIDNPYQRGDTPRRNTHPTVKPISLIRHLVRLVTPVGGFVLDPFMGSGTTGIACALEGLRFVGVELSEEYCQIASQRIAHATRQLSLWRGQTEREVGE